MNLDLRYDYLIKYIIKLYIYISYINTILYFIRYFLIFVRNKNGLIID